MKLAPWTGTILFALGAALVGVGCSSSNDPARVAGGATGGTSGSSGSGGSINTGGAVSGGASGTSLVGGGGASGSSLVGGGAGVGASVQTDADVGDNEVTITIGPDASCGGQKVTATAKKVNILLVIDKSGSMADTPTGFTMSKWTALKTALGDSLDQVKGGIAMGLELYPMSPDPLSPILPACTTNCCAMQQGAVDVGITLGTTALPTILDTITKTTPAGGTPTAVALNNALGYFTAGPGKDLQGEKYVLLATDGAPNCNGTTKCDVAHCTLNIESTNQCAADAGLNCCANPGLGPACLDDTSTVDQITKLKAAGVGTFVIGIPGTELYSSFLDSFAVAGGEQASNFTDASSGPKYFAVSASGGVAALTAVFKSITTVLIKSCDLQLAAVPPDLKLLNVKVNGQIVPQSGADGWDVDQTTTPPTIRIKGATCSDIKTNGAESVEVIYGCPTVIIY